MEPEFLEGKMIWVIAGLAIVAIALFMSGTGSFDIQDSNPDEVKNATWAYTGETDLFYNWYWALETGRVDAPEGVDMKAISGSQLVTTAASGGADISWVSMLQLGTATSGNPDLQLTGHAFKPDDTYYTLYAREDSDIESISDLEGKTVSAPLYLSTGILTAMIIEEEVGNPDSVTIVDKPSGAMKAVLESGDVDAALMFGENPEFTPIVHVYKYWNENFEGRLTEALWYVDGEQYYDKGREAARAYNRSFDVGMENFDQMTSDFTAETGKNLSNLFRSNDGATIYNINQKDIEAYQSLIDFAYEEGYIEKHVEVRDVISDQYSVPEN